MEGCSKSTGCRDRRGMEGLLDWENKNRNLRIERNFSDMENCQHGNFAPVNTRILPNSQAGIERHKCVICAYQGG